MTNEQDERDARPPFYDLTELAARWRIPEKEVIRMVRLRAVPFVRMTSSIGRVKWDRVRFSVPAIEAWERTSQEHFGRPPMPVGPEGRPVGSKPGGKSGGRLGNWRQSSPV